MNIDSLLRIMEKQNDPYKALKELYNTGGNIVISQYSEAVPFLLYKTHAITSVNGVEKAISVPSLKSILSSLSSETEEEVAPMCLPFGCFMFSRKGEFLYLSCYYKECMAEIKYDPRDPGSGKIEKYTIPMPNVIISFTLKKAEKNTWQVHEATYLSTSKSVTQLPDNDMIRSFNPKIGVYKLPLSNIYPQGKMCFGNNTMPVRFTDNLRGLDYYYQILTLAPFNSDLGVNGLKQTYQPRTWFKHLSTLKSFPYDLLSEN